MAKRRTAQLQRRTRASEQAMTRRLSVGGGTLDWRLAAIGGAIVLVLVVVVVALLFIGGSSAYAGTIEPDAGRAHIADGTYGGPYSSVPATSGPHWQDPANWGVYTDADPLAESQSIHNLEHGGIVVWYQPGKVSAADLAKLTDFISVQVTTSKFKFILSPWTGQDFGHPIGVTAWRWLLYLDTANVDAIRGFADAHYGNAPEPLAGPAAPGT
jgi:Protein of unknown function (DUF3105)